LLGGGVIGLWSMGTHLYQSLGAMMEQAFLFDRNQAFDVSVMLRQVAALASHSLITLIPLFLALAVVALLAPMLLGGWLISAKSLAPKLSKLNPVKGLKRLVSSQMLAELGKAIAKSLLVGGVAIAFLLHQRGAFIAL